MLQAFGVARQMLSLVAGSAIDEYLLSQLRQLRQPHTLARIIHALQNKLWPGGVWFQHTDKYMQQHPVSFLNLSNCELATMEHRMSWQSNTCAQSACVVHVRMCVPARVCVHICVLLGLWMQMYKALTVNCYLEQQCMHQKALLSFTTARVPYTSQ